MSGMTKHIETLSQVAVLIVAVCVLLIPELRTEAARHVLVALMVVELTLVLYRLHASGVLGLTPKELVHARSRRHLSLLSHAAMVLGILAMFILLFG